MNPLFSPRNIRLSAELEVIPEAENPVHNRKRRFYRAMNDPEVF
jgi:hypothetical protein